MKKQKPTSSTKKGKTYTPNGLRHNVYLSIRLTGKELADFRALASKQGVGVSTFGRMLVKAAIERKE